MKKLVLAAALAASIAVVAAPSAGAAADAKGPPCANIINGDGRYGSATNTSDYTLHFEYAVKAAPCTDATYSLLVYDTDGNLLTTLSSSGSCTTLNSTTYPYCFAYDANLTGFPNVVCIVGQTSIRGRTVDVAPNEPSAGCALGFALARGVSGGTSNFH